MGFRLGRNGRDVRWGTAIMRPLTSAISTLLMALVELLIRRLDEYFDRKESAGKAPDD